MARNRMIKSEFFSDEKIGVLTHTGRLLFIGMWIYADDSGVCKGNANFLKSSIFPYDYNLEVEEIEEELKNLKELDLIIEIIHNRQRYYLIQNFNKHQVINKPSVYRHVPIEYIAEELSRHGYNPRDILIK